MASKDRHQWDDALKEYIDPLDRRFPENPYKSTTHTWRDKIALATVEGRARMLQSPVNTKLSQPNDLIEDAAGSSSIRWSWPPRSGTTTSPSKRPGRNWRSSTAPDDNSEPPWHFLATRQAEAERRQIDQRRERVTKLLSQAQEAENVGRGDEARSIRAEVTAKEGQYTSIADLLPAPHAGKARRPPAQLNCREGLSKVSRKPGNSPDRATVRWLTRCVTDVNLGLTFHNRGGALFSPPHFPPIVGRSGPEDGDAPAPRSLHRQS